MSETPVQSLRRALAEAGVEVTPEAIQRGADDAMRIHGTCPRCGRDTRYGLCLNCPEAP